MNWPAQNRNGVVGASLVTTFMTAVRLVIDRKGFDISTASGKLIEDASDATVGVRGICKVDVQC